MPILQKQIDQIDNVGGSIVIPDFSGGLNTKESNEILKDNEAIIRKNWGQDTQGAIKKVGGFTKSNATALASAAVLGLFRVYISAGTSQGLSICNGVLKYSTDDFVTNTQATSGTGLSTTDFNTGVNYNDLFFFTNETDNVQVYTPGTKTLAAATDQPTDACGIIFKRADRRLVALKNATNGSTLYYSKIDPTGAAADDWSASNDAGAIAIEGTKSEPLTTGINYGAVDIIFKDSKAFKVWGYPAPQVLHMPGSPGCIAPHSLAGGDGLIFFLSNDGIYMYDGNKFILISYPIELIINEIKRTTYLQNIWGVYRDGKYWLFYTHTSHTTNQDCLIYDVEKSNPYVGKNIWFERDGLKMQCPIVFDGPGDSNELYAGDSASTGFVYRLDFSATGADNVSNINGVYQTKYYTTDYPHLIKKYPKVYIRYYLPVGTITVNWYTNRGATTGSFTIAASAVGTKLGDFLLGTDALVAASGLDSTVVQRLPDTAVGKDISLKFTHNNTGAQPVIRDAEILWEGLYVE